jgi:hypothetical protein
MRRLPRVSGSALDFSGRILALPSLHAWSDCALRSNFVVFGCNHFGFRGLTDCGGTAQSAVAAELWRGPLCGAAGDMRAPSNDGMAMDTGLYRVETTGLPGLAGIFGSYSATPAKTAVKYLPSKLIWLSVVLIVGSGAWLVLSGSTNNTTAIVEREPLRLATASASEPIQSPTTGTAQDESSLNPQVTPAEEIAPVETSPVDGLKISSQSWRRGGLGSKALITLTLRNANEYAVKDIEIFCSFARRDGSHLTDRTRVIHDTVSMRSQKTFARMHVGFVNINANQAKCSLVAASPV